jgi:carbonic anhydrase
MNCTNQTAPINIDINNINGKCDLKCKYSFKYQENNAIEITNKNDYLLLSYENGLSPSVIFNSNTYNVKEIRLYTPSLHSYNGFKLDAELVIVHSPITGTKPLLVCLPIKESESGNLNSIQLKTIINRAKKQTVKIDLPKFNLNTFVPRKPFFSYFGTNPYLPCGGSNDFIVFEPLHTEIYISSETLQKLKEIIDENGYNINKNEQLYYNELGPEVGDGSDKIYIDCQPIGQTDEEVFIVKNDTSMYKFSFSNILNYTYIQVIFGSLLFVALIYIANMIFGFFSKKNNKQNIVDNIIKGGTKLTKYS